jgi:GTP cyclohydrolase I
MAAIAPQPEPFGPDPFGPEPFAMTTFENDGGYEDMVVVRDLAFRTSCVHDGLPVGGVVHVGYLPETRIVGLSKFARLVDHRATFPETLQRFAQGIADALDVALQPRGVGVVVETSHDCSGGSMAKPGARTVTTELRGVLREEAEARREFLDLVLRPRVRPRAR